MAAGVLLLRLPRNPKSSRRIQRHHVAEAGVPSSVASGGCQPEVLITCELRNNTLQKLVGMRADVMTSGNRKGAYYGAAEQEAGEEELVSGFRDGSVPAGQRVGAWGRGGAVQRPVGDCMLHASWTAAMAPVACCDCPIPRGGRGEKPDPAN